MRSALPEGAARGRAAARCSAMCSPPCAPPAVPMAAVVVGPGARCGRAPKRGAVLPGADVFVQAERRGTAHAVLAARERDRARRRRRPGRLRRYAADPAADADRGCARALAAGAAVAVLGFRPADPTGYGRLVRRGRRARRHPRGEGREPGGARDRPLQRRPDGARRPRRRSRSSTRIGNDNRQARILSHRRGRDRARRWGCKAVALETEEDDVRGINTKAQLAEAEAALQQRLRKAAMEAGVTLVAPETVFLAADTKLGRDVVIEPYVVFGPGVTVEDGAVIRSFSHLEGAHVGKGARGRPVSRGCGPARELGEDVHIGNFVEVKEARDRGRRQGQPPQPISATPRRRGRQYRRRHHHLQLRRRRQAPHRDRQGRLHRLELGAGRAGEDRRRRLCRLRLGDHRGRAGRTRWRSAAGGRSLRKAGRRACARARPRARRSRPPNEADRRVSRNCHSRDAF